MEKNVYLCSVFVKPIDQSQDYLFFGMARKHLMK